MAWFFRFISRFWTRAINSWHLFIVHIKPMSFYEEYFLIDLQLVCFYGFSKYQYYNNNENWLRIVIVFQSQKYVVEIWWHFFCSEIFIFCNYSQSCKEDISEKISWKNLRISTRNTLWPWCRYWHENGHRNLSHTFCSCVQFF